MASFKHAPSACSDPGDGGHAPGYPPTNGGARGRGGRRLRCWQQVALVTRCGGGRGVCFPMSSLHSSSSSSHKHRRELLPRLYTRTEEGGRLRSRITHRCSRLAECLHSCFLSQSTRVYFLCFFWESAERVNTVQACLSARIFKRQRAPVALTWICLSVRVVFPLLTTPKSLLYQRKSFVFAFLVFPFLPCTFARAPCRSYIYARVCARALIGSERAA